MKSDMLTNLHRGTALFYFTVYLALARRCSHRVVTAGANYILLPFLPYKNCLLTSLLVHGLPMFYRSTLFLVLVIIEEESFYNANVLLSSNVPEIVFLHTT